MDFSIAIADVPARAEYTAAGSRDPFKRQFMDEMPLAVKKEKVKEKTAAEKTTPPPQINVDGIIASRRESYAIIGGKVTRAGDKIGEALITEISKEGVTVVYDLERFFYPGPSRTLAGKKKKDDQDEYEPSE